VIKKYLRKFKSKLSVVLQADAEPHGPATFDGQAEKNGGSGTAQATTLYLCDAEARS
jgi:hypothetical protein